MRRISFIESLVYACILCIQNLISSPLDSSNWPDTNTSPQSLQSSSQKHHNQKYSPEDFSPYQKSSIALLSDNDAYFDSLSDRYYSAGTMLIYSSKEFDLSNTWIRFLSLNASKKSFSSFSLSLDQNIYTPLKRDRIIPPNDFPYAGFLNLGISISNRRKNSLETLAAQIGVVGPLSGAKEVQNLIHRITKNPIFLGWDNQLKNEFIFNAYYDFVYRYNILEFPSIKNLSIDTLPNISISLGNANSYIGLGARIRIGFNLQTDFGPRKIYIPSGGSRTYLDPLTFYVFTGIMGKYIARDIFVQGNSFDPTNLRLNYLAYNAEIGLTIAYKGFSFSYVIVETSPPFKGALHHKFGSIVLTFAF